MPCLGQRKEKKKYHASKKEMDLPQLRAVGARQRAHPFTALCIQEHNLKKDRATKTAKEALAHKLLLIINPVPEGDTRGGTAITIPLAVCHDADPQKAILNRRLLCWYSMYSMP